MSPSPAPSSCELRHCADLYRRLRRRTRPVMVGRVGVGGDNPLRLQSMTTTDTMDTAKTVEQSLRMVEAGCEIVRITTPTAADARNLGKIKEELLKRGCDVPLVADVHFQPAAAMEAAEWADKVRINPGNFVDNKRFAVVEYTDADYAEELERIEAAVTPLIEKLKRLKRALRIGTNHGSLSDRIMNRYGDSPLGMVESALEYVRVCEKLGYRDIILSMKASNPKVMIAAYRLLAARMGELGMDYPFHLGVTEAGSGEDGRVKSAIGIGSLLEDGIGDTIRVSLTEDPEFEIPVCRDLARRFQPDAQPRARKIDPVPAKISAPYCKDFFSFERRKTASVRVGPFRVGGEHPARVITRWEGLDAGALLAFFEEQLKTAGSLEPEILEFAVRDQAGLGALARLRGELQAETSRLAYFARVEGPLPLALAALSTADLVFWSGLHGAAGADAARFLGEARAKERAVFLEASDAEDLLRMEAACRERGVGALLCLCGGLHAWRRLAARLAEAGSEAPLHLKAGAQPDEEAQVLESSILIGSLLCDGLGDSVQIDSGLAPRRNLTLVYNVLQAAGTRITKTEYVSCPSCGRTLFDLQSTTERIQSKTGHLKGVKIAIMGCIVNGPGEMADADFGYVGGAPERINLYVGKECVQKGIPSASADQALIDLIKQHGKWVEPPQG
ncbi:MAG TPA: (E)-4-hydroxy-3-methylbut-2-enyl-diphosphate synthase [Elusimicrobiota bacterium]|nr:(E)-4-hydroxy-3-methylbut-2-enyl-diphosphate synthase [Elusimicrobiota bacterium]